MSSSDHNTRNTAHLGGIARAALPIGRDVGPLRLLTLALGIAVVGLGLFVLVSAMQRPDDGTPRTAAERTLIDARSAIEADPRDIDARVRLARVYTGMGQYEAALQMLDAAEELEPDNLAVVHMLGLTHLESGNGPAAIPYLERATELKGGFAEDYVGIWSDMARALALQDDLTGAAGAYEQALVYAPQAADVIFDLAQTYERLDRRDEAIRAYEGVLQYIPGHSGAIQALARLSPIDS